MQSISITLFGEAAMAVEWTITIEEKNEFGDVCLKAVHIDKSWERLFDSGVGAGSANERSSFFDGSAYLVALADASQRTDFGHPQASIRLRMATPIAASVC